MTVSQPKNDFINCDFRIITPYIESCALANPDVKVVLVNFEQHIALAQEHQIRLVPTFMLVDGDNKVVGKVTNKLLDGLHPLLVSGFRHSVSICNYAIDQTLWEWCIKFSQLDFSLCSSV